MNKRLKELRKNILNLTLKDFGNEISLSPGALGDIENGRRILQDRHIKLICQTFNVNEEWLRNGVEPIFKEDNKEKPLIDIIEEEYNLNPLSKHIIDTYLNLDKKEQVIFENFAKKLFKEANISFEENETSNNITEFPTPQEDTSDKVKIIARGKGITYIDREEFEEIKRNSKQLTDDEISDFLD